jgi:hypothetical protein
MSVEELERRFKQVQVERFDPEKLLEVVTHVNESLRPSGANRSRANRPRANRSRANRSRANVNKIKRLTSLQGSVRQFINHLPQYEKVRFNPYVANMNRRRSRYGRPGRISKRALSRIRNTN